MSRRPHKADSNERGERERTYEEVENNSSRVERKAWIQLQAKIARDKGRAAKIRQRPGKG